KILCLRRRKTFGLRQSPRPADLKPVLKRPSCWKNCEKCAHSLLLLASSQKVISPMPPTWTTGDKRRYPAKARLGSLRRRSAAKGFFSDLKRSTFRLGRES